MKATIVKITLLGLIVFSLAGFASETNPDLLVVMSGSGKVERYETGTGRHLGAFIVGAPQPNRLAFGPDGQLYLTTGAVGGPGTVRKYDGRTGRFLGEFIALKPGAPGFLARANGLAWGDGDLFVASCDDSKVHRYDGRTGGFKATVATGDPTGWITEIALREGALFTTEFKESRLGRYPLTGGPGGVFVAQAGFSPWGITFDSRGRCWWSGVPGIARFDGATNTVLIGADEVTTPIGLATSPDGLLVCSSLGKQSVTLWDVSGVAPRLVRTILGPEVRDPMGIAFTTNTAPVTTSVTVGGSLKPTRPELPPTQVRFEADTRTAALTSLGWDTEGGSRASLNLLRAPAVLNPLKGNAVLPAQVSFGMPDADTVRYRLQLDASGALTWQTALEGPDLVMRFGGENMSAAGVTGAELILPLDPRRTATCVLGNDWVDEKRLRPPFIMSAPDIGQMLVTVVTGARAPDTNLMARWEGSRLYGTATLTFEIPVASLNDGLALNFRPVVLAPPAGLKDSRRWAMARRGWFNMLQLTAWRAAEPGQALTPAGLWANNLISDPVCNTTYWLGDHVQLIPELAPGVSAVPMLRRTLDLWLERPNAEGTLPYTFTDQSGTMADSNPSTLIAAWSYVNVSKDLDWLSRQIEKLERLSAFMERRDVDHDGLIESVLSGNRGTHSFGDTAWDTISSGHKNAYVNALAHRAWLGLADLERRLSRPKQGERYSALAAKLRAAYVPAFYDPAAGWLGWWRSADGQLHTLWSDVPTSMAVNNGVLDAKTARPMLEKYLAALDASGFERFDLGVPLALKPIHRDDQFQSYGGKKEDGSDTFGNYLNGGVCVSNTSYLLAALYAAGLNERADRILDAMLRRQRDGVFANGGGFQNGVINRGPEGAEFYDWKGKTCGYEGHLVYSWTWLQALFAREGIHQAKTLKPLQ